MKYDQNNIFAQIINNKIKAEKLYEDESVLAIKDINPASPLHILVMPKKGYIDFADFVSNAGSEEVAHYFNVISKIAKENSAENYRIVSNKGSESGQSVFHFHTHILSGFKNPDLINKNL